MTTFKILVPLVEKLAEHLTAVDEAHDNQVNNIMTTQNFHET